MRVSRIRDNRPLSVNHLSNKFATLYDPSKHVTVDEAMIKFQGRSSLKQYMPMKPIKRGIKVWVLGDSTNGYFSRFDVYTGRQENREVGLGEKVDGRHQTHKTTMFISTTCLRARNSSKISNVMASTAVGPPGKIEGDFPLL